MLLSFFNPDTLGDVLLVVLAEDVEHQGAKTSGDVTRIYNQDNDSTIGFNIRNVKSKLQLDEIGQIMLNQDQVKALNNIIKDAGFDETLEFDDRAKFVVGHVDEISEHPDSDHLHITKINVGNEQLQIVCGAPNIDQGQNVVVAITGAVMPTGKIIWPGKLRGVESFGMVCSAKELDLPNAPKERGILVLPDTLTPGAAFNFTIEG
ncbi:tRNA-binding protein [Companilactobacillus sp. RD055328]|uniref:YtpR family tRNA-binding protein n=1 Tax=Companilactobacillus sp. RD055328 TaxID=2916634 RepID=UPI001FC869E1|nr:DUF4479 family protein [Companilactobacillus sp. RD055328]GKQ42498.1 tRNA-binding protein [Companilactobacillus sp. RD055328]